MLPSLGIAQPSLSAGIKQLEGQLGVQLVWRGSRFGGLTPEGHRVLVWARQIVGDTRTMREEMRTVGRGLSGQLRLAVVPTALTIAAQLTALSGNLHPQVGFAMLSRTSEEILGMLGNLDVHGGSPILTTSIRAASPPFRSVARPIPICVMRLRPWRIVTTVVNNVISLATVPVIFARGAQYYHDFSLGRTRGTTPIQIARNVKHGGLSRPPSAFPWASWSRRSAAALRRVPVQGGAGRRRARRQRRHAGDGPLRDGVLRRRELR